MDTVTYPDPRVAELVNANFAPVKINIREPQQGGVRELLRTVKPVWAPLFVFLDPARVELRRYVGWLAPDEFLAELTFVLGMQDILRQRIDEAFTRFRAAADEWPESSVAAEALFWAGTAAYKKGRGDLVALRAVWDELVARYPASTWARRANVWDMQR